MPAARRQQSPKKPVRRARQARSRATVEAIVEAAARILADAGWERVNTNAIARRAGVSVGSVYEYFPNKQAILDVIVDRHLSRGEALLRERAARAPADMAPADVVRALVEAFVGLHRDDPALHRALASELPSSPEQRARIDALRDETIALVTAALHGQVEHPRLKATLLVDAADAIVHRWLIDEVGVPVAPERMQAELETMLCRYADERCAD